MKERFVPWNIWENVFSENDLGTFSLTNYLRILILRNIWKNFCSIFNSEILIRYPSAPFPKIYIPKFPSNRSNYRKVSQTSVNELHILCWCVSAYTLVVHLQIKSMFDRVATYQPTLVSVNVCMTYQRQGIKNHQASRRTPLSNLYQLRSISRINAGDSFRVSKILI